MGSDIQAVIDYIPYIVGGLKFTLALVAGGIGLGFLIGLPVATGRFYGGKWVDKILSIYVWIFRGIPLVVQLFLLYYGVLRPFLGLGPFVSSIVILGLRSGSYQSQIFRGALQSVGGEQMMAARSQGMSKRTAILYIIYPQVLRASLPGWANEYAILLKDSSITFTLGVTEVLTRANYATIPTGLVLLPYLFVGVLFIFLTYGGTGFINLLYERFKIPGLLERA
ncbi:MAG: amino acid ABC transporter permease [candidate division WOR-3 bacterium]|nr:amino acid ABC transporter permease [candidate division WOR-3 bacterium]